MATIWGLGKPLAAALLVAVMVGLFVGDGSAGAGTEPRATTRTVTIPASAFNPMSDIIAYSRGASYLETRSGSGLFLAPIFFEAPTVTIKKVVFYAIDSGIAYLVMDVYRTQPGAQENLLLGETTTSGSSFSMQAVTL